MAHTRNDTGVRVIASSGSRPPIVKATIDANAACQALVSWFGSMPNSMSAWAANASCSVSSWATFFAVS